MTMSKYSAGYQLNEHGRLRILVIDDDPAFRSAIERYLERHGYRIDTAASAAQARIEAERNPPRVIVCDWKLGTGEDGTMVARDLQHRYRAAVIFVTAHCLREIRKCTADLEVETYLEKPFPPDQLLASVVAATMR